jgi:hypothetical protein
MDAERGDTDRGSRGRRYARGARSRDPDVVVADALAADGLLDVLRTNFEAISTALAD